MVYSLYGVLRVDHVNPKHPISNANISNKKTKNKRMNRQVDPKTNAIEDFEISY